MASMQQRIKLRVRVEPGIPKLLVKINPSEAETLSAKNLGEVTLRKAAAQRGHVAVLHMSLHVAPGEMLMSLKLAEILDVEEDESVEVSSTPAGSGSGAANTPQEAGYSNGASGLGYARLGAAAGAKGVDDSLASRYPTLQRRCPSAWMASSSMPDTAPMAGGGPPPEAFAPRQYGGSARFSSNIGLDARRGGLESDDMLGGWWAQSRGRAHPSLSSSTRAAADRASALSPREAAATATAAEAPAPSPPSLSRGLWAGDDANSAATDWLRNFRAVTENHAYETSSILAAHRQRFASAGNEASAGPIGGPLGGNERAAHFHHDPVLQAAERLRSYSSGSGVMAGHDGGNARCGEASRAATTGCSGEPVPAGSHGDRHAPSGAIPSRSEAPRRASGLRAEDEFVEGFSAAPDVDLLNGRDLRQDQIGALHASAMLDGIRRRQQQHQQHQQQQQQQQQQHLDGRQQLQQDYPLQSDLLRPRVSMQRSGPREEEDELKKTEVGAYARDRWHEGGHPKDTDSERRHAADEDGCGKLNVPPDLVEKQRQQQRQQRHQLRQHRQHYRQRADSELRAWCEANTAAPPNGSRVSATAAGGGAGAAGSKVAGSAVWNAPTPQRTGTAAPAVAESLEPSPLPSPRGQSCASASSCSASSSRSPSPRDAATPLRSAGQWGRDPVQTAPSAINGSSYSAVSGGPSSGHSSAPGVSHSGSGTNIGCGSEGYGGSSCSQPKRANQAEAPAASGVQASAHAGVTDAGASAPLLAPATGVRSSIGSAIVPLVRGASSPASGVAAGSTPTASIGRKRGNANLLHRRKSVSLGSIQPEPPELTGPLEPREPIPSTWRPPVETGGGGLERSELGSEVTVEVRRWLMGETTGRQCSQVVLDRALTVLSNFKLASGCQLEVLGGPLGAIVGGYSDADWLHDEVFKKQPIDAIREAFALLGFRAPPDGDWTCMAAEEVSLAYRRQCLRGHPSRGGAPRTYLKLQVAMELIRAFSGEAGPLEPARSSASGFMLDDTALARELQLTAAQAEEEAMKLPQEDLEEMNRALDEYILRQMCFKSEIVDEIARLHEDSAYAILGVSSDATDAEIKRAYKLIAMQCHPDKGGDKEDFQELNSAYEKIMEQRKTNEDKWPRRKAAESEKDDDSEDEQRSASKSKAEADKKGGDSSGDKPEKDKTADEGDDANSEDGEGGDGKAQSSPDGGAEAEGEDFGEEGSNATLIDKAGKAAEEASRYAKTAAEFAHQAAEAAETARRGREQGSRDTLTKSIAHSAIVLTLTVVKAVRVVGYATLDVAAQCRIAAKRNPEALGCAERAVSAMSLGLEALNAALACAEVTETTAAELQAPPSAEAAASAGDAGCTAAAERFVGAAVRASLAAASASNAAMSAAIAAVEGSRECMRALESQPPAGGAKEDGAEEKADKDSEEAPEDASDGSEAEDDDGADASQPPPRQPSPAEAAAAVTRRLVVQRNNNHKVLQRLNAEILGHQRNVRQFLQTNRQLIPQVSHDSKCKVFGLLRDYVSEARSDLGLVSKDSSKQPEAMLEAVKMLPILVPFLQPQDLAIPVSVKARVLKMSALYDLPAALAVLDEELFSHIGAAIQSQKAKATFDELFSKVRAELKSNVAEDGAP